VVSDAWWQSKDVEEMTIKKLTYPKRTKEDFESIFYVIRATKRYGWRKLAQMMKDAGIDGSQTEEEKANTTST
jgi:hypothetical protein